MLFRDLSFALSGGQGLQIMGPNGVGKTSLLHILAGLARAERGTITLPGATDEVRGAVQYLGAKDGLKNALTAAEHLVFWAGLAGRPRPARADIMVFLAQFGLARQIDLPAAVLSTGQRKRLSLARLDLDPSPVVLMDEPLNALDSEGQTLLRAWLGKRLQHGAIAIVATHQALDVPGFTTLALAPLDALAGLS